VNNEPTAHDLVSDELTAVAAELERWFPETDPARVRTVVAQVYDRIARAATITEHLIPLTLIRARAALAQPT